MVRVYYRVDRDTIHENPPIYGISAVASFSDKPVRILKDGRLFA